MLSFAPTALAAPNRSRAAAVARAGAIRGNFSWTLAGNVVYAACQWGMLAAIARLGTVSDVGEFAFALALTAPVFLFANLNLRTLQATDQRHEYSFREYGVLRGAGLAVGVGLVAVAGVLGSRSTGTLAVLAGVTAMRIFDSCSDLIYGRLQQAERMDRIAASRAIQGVLQLLAIIVGMGVVKRLDVAVALFALASGAVTLAYDLRSVRLVSQTCASANLASPRQGSELRRLGGLAAMAMPLGVIGILDSLNASLPRLLLDQAGGRAELGGFAVVAYFLVAQGTIVGAMADAARPRLARMALSSLPAFQSLTRRLAVAGAVFSGLGVLLAARWGGVILGAVYGSKFDGYGAALVWVMVGGVFWTSASVNYAATNALRVFRPQLPVFLAMLATTAAVSWALVSRYGATGAAVALASGFFVRWIGSAFVKTAAVRARTVEVGRGDEAAEA